MADEVTYASIGDLRNSSELHRETEFLLHDATDLRVTMRRVKWGPDASAAIKRGQIKPNDVMTAPGEATDPGNTALTDSSYLLTVALYTLIRDVTDLVELTGGKSMINVQGLAKLMKMSADTTITTMLTALFPSLSNTVGSTGVACDVDDIYDAMYQLATSLANPPFYCVLYPKQLNNFKASLRGETGAVQFVSKTAEMLELKGPGFQGEWNGVQFWTSNTVPTANAGADSNGAMYSLECFSFTEADIADKLATYMPKAAKVDGLRLLVEYERNGRKGATDVIGHYYPAVSEANDAAGVGIVTDR